MLHGVEASKSRIELACTRKMSRISPRELAELAEERGHYGRYGIVHFPFRFNPLCPFNRPPRSSRLVEVRSERARSARKTHANESVTISTWFRGSCVTIADHVAVNQPSSVVSGDWSRFPEEGDFHAKRNHASRRARTTCTESAS